ncbi:hypothetical protein BDN72DRAFT_781396, partial [Pluteus cervinus]
MRYKACTADDIRCLKKRVHSFCPGRSKVTNKEFRNVSIITSLNIFKDTINELGSQRFAKETEQDLVDFYSEDTLSTNVDSDKPKGRRHKQKKIISTEVQQILWNQPVSTSDKNIPGKLSLCIGLPIMIRTNIATELCMTKGQEGTVYGWSASIGSKGQSILDILFIKLDNPPQSIKFDDLPENVVPIYKTTTATTCSLPNDTKISISRTQVEVLPNFAMTDYASQGKTRKWNVVDLNNCRSHQAVYTALSRGTSAAGTLILQGFDEKKIKGMASGYLRQEF